MAIDPFTVNETSYSRYGGATTQMPRFDNTNATYSYTAAPGSPRYSDVAGERPWYDPRDWSLRKKLIVAACIVVVIIAVVVGAVEGVKANAYPNYSRLSYNPVDVYSGASFFDNFEYFTGYDPTKGFVHYVDSAAANQLNLTHASDTTAVLRVDTAADNQTTGRRSVRITSHKKYDHGLFIFDVVHSPYGCSTWPALWLTDPSNWPDNGEIDVVESNNKGTHGNSMTLHTTKNCKMDVKRKQSGSTQQKDCLYTANANAGCGVEGPKSSYGEDFNKNGGGVYAMELRDAGIRMWMFPRDKIPSDISSNSSSPDPSKWGEAASDFPSTHCNIGSHFRNQSIVANIDICGEMAGSSKFYTDMYSCPTTCSQFAAEMGGNFTDAYWEFNSFKVYQA
ncbi:hypothetical protein N7492_007360 [Penicillium capsulatum]|uniref:endo-1,3(4)-beta-glucanase n=1 Tax=Penicillium capsulatum TaxID=69766 RepID=A0A9W9I1V0_9EURO|nr:hypothetical protein N7492_007360 [Penicillium capsulatum]KAJ6117200.1 hypothetical protein N7512_006925 [Penicillium capsulatum]